MLQSIILPDQLYGELFTAVQMSRVFEDSKTFVDSVPKRDPHQIVQDYHDQKDQPGFDLKKFVEEKFFIPRTPVDDYKTQEHDVVDHINRLWTVLRRKSDNFFQGGSLLPLPFEYIVPGGRFREIYYWDTYFTMLGLKESRQYELMENMVKNLAYLINEYGHMPNGNRSYYLSRSQPPYFSLLLDLLSTIKGPNVYKDYLIELEKEYGYWMDESGKTNHLVKMPDGSILNRYYDQLCIPRQESYIEDVTVTKDLDPEQRAAAYRHIRSACESGWDFSSRWLKDHKKLSSIQTTDMIPVDLNCLLLHIEMTLSKTYKEAGNEVKAESYNKAAQQRKKAIEYYCWSEEQGWYVDYHIVLQQPSTTLTLAGVFPFFFNVSDPQRMETARHILKDKFVCMRGVVATPERTDEQWDAPNGWACLLWMTIIGLENYGEAALAKDIAERWVNLNKKVFKDTGKLVEKYDVMDADKPGGGGEYPYQDGFGWTNGVLLALIKKYNLQ